MEINLTVRVSVILPTFNRSRTLAAAVNSVLAQSYGDLELIVVDDCSSEDIEGLVRAVDDERVRYVRRATNGGAGAARNTGLAEAKGTYIAFQDSDDIWLPRKLERQLALFKGLPDTIGVVTGAKILYGRDEAFNFGPAKIAYAPSPARPLRLDEDQRVRLLSENRISVQNALFRKDCYPGRVWFDECARANEDWEFATRLVQHTKVFEDIEPVVLGFISSDGISSNSRKQTIGLLRIINKNREILETMPKVRSLLLIDVAIYMFNAGKRKSASKFVLAALQVYPLHTGKIAVTAVRRSWRAVRSRLRKPAVVADNLVQDPKHEFVAPVL